jgi:hypothetical protein
MTATKILQSKLKSTKMTQRFKYRSSSRSSRKSSRKQKSKKPKSSNEVGLQKSSYVKHFLRKESRRKESIAGRTGLHSSRFRSAADEAVKRTFGKNLSAKSARPFTDDLKAFHDQPMLNKNLSETLQNARLKVDEKKVEPRPGDYFQGTKKQLRKIKLAEQLKKGVIEQVLQHEANSSKHSKFSDNLKSKVVIRSMRQEENEKPYFYYGNVQSVVGMMKDKQLELAMKFHFNPKYEEMRKAPRELKRRLRL